MDLDDQRMTAGLIFGRRLDRTIQTIMPYVSGALAGFDIPITDKCVISDSRATVQTADRLIHLALAPETWADQSDDPGQILHLCVEDRRADMGGPGSEVILAEITTRLFLALGPSHVSWLDAAILSHAEFADITSAAPTVLDMPKWRDTSIAHIRDDRRASRMPAWALSIKETSTPPLCTAFATVNPLKRDTLRYGSQAAAILGLFTALDSRVASPQTLELVDQILG